MGKKIEKVWGTISLSEISRPKKLVTQKIKINGLSLEIGRPANSKRLPTHFKSLL